MMPPSCFHVIRVALRYVPCLLRSTGFAWKHFVGFPLSHSHRQAAPDTVFQAVLVRETLLPSART